MSVIDSSRALMAALQDPFAFDEIKWRVGTGRRTPRGDRATLLTYIDARAVMDRLDEVVGPARWRNAYRQGPDGGQLCRIELLLETRPDVWEWVHKEDGASNTQIEAVKGGLSDAFKRAAVPWGIGRYLYRLPTNWYDVQGGEKAWANGHGVDVSIKVNKTDKYPTHVGWIPYPKLPSWALPSGKEPASAAQVRRGKHDPEWEDGGRARFMAKLSELGLKYDALRWFVTTKGKDKRKPSERTAEERAEILRWLEDPAQVERVRREFFEGSQG